MLQILRKNTEAKFYCTKIGPEAKKFGEVKFFWIFLRHVLDDVLDLGLLVVEREICEVCVQSLASIQLKQVVVGPGGKTVKNNLCNLFCLTAIAVGLGIAARAA